MLPFIKYEYFNNEKVTKKEYCKPTLFKLSGFIKRIMERVNNSKFVFDISIFSCLLIKSNIVNMEHLITDIEKLVKNI